MFVCSMCIRAVVRLLIAQQSLRQILVRHIPSSPCGPETILFAGRLAMSLF